MASAGHPLALGYLLAVALGFWLYLRKYVESRVTRAAIGVFWIASLLAPYSRGPWIVAAVIPTVAACFSPKPFSRVVRLMAFGLAGLLLIVASPAGDRITSVLPFFGGTVDTFNIDYRQRLLQRSFEIIRASPFFGDPRALLKMHDLRQGQGIIDIVNTYIEVLLNSGVVGLFLLLAFAFVGIRRAWLSRARVAPHDSDLGLLGGAILSCTAGTLVMMADGSFGTALEYMYFALIGLLSAYAVVARRSLFMNSQFDSSPNESRLMLTARRGQ
jgi:O-antigen ligase